MFATLLGGLPSPEFDTVDDKVEAAIRAQEEAGLEPVTDGRLCDPRFERLTSALVGGRGDEPLTVRDWQFATSRSERAVKQALPGPYSLGRGAGAGAGADRGADRSADAGRGARRPGTAGRVSERAHRMVGSAKQALIERERRTMAYADALRREVEALAAAGCALIEIEETAAHLIGEDPGERRLFREAHERLVEGVRGTHLSLSIVGGSAAGAGIETILAAPYASLAVDLVAGPDNWKLAVDLPGDRGVVAGAMTDDESTDQPKELLIWAAHYAASTGGRGIARVGLGSAGSFDNLTWASAVRKMQRLGEAARLGAMPASDELMRALNPAAISARRAALGPDAPPPPRPRRR